MDDQLLYGGRQPQLPVLVTPSNSTTAGPSSAVKIKMTKFALKRGHHRERRLDADRALKMVGGR